VDKIKKFQGNEYTAFGTALHYLCEQLVVDNSKVDEGKFIFQTKFLEELTEISKTHSLDKKLVNQMRTQGDDLVEFVLPALSEYFGNYKVFSVEELLLEDIVHFETDYKFKGFVDLILQTDDGKYHVIDWKTCSWGWNAKKRSDKIITYQLTLYKKFFSLKYNIDVDSIETHFALLKRTAKKDKAEIFRVTSGDKKMDNALSLLRRAIMNIQSGLAIKDRTSCRYCEFYQTEHCR
jgi:ATP-dependent exoDNAse (exonuclease V) beta subunit